MKDYSAGLTSQLFWLQEARKTASLMVEGKDRSAIKEIAWSENIYQVGAEYRAVEVLNATYRRISKLPEPVISHFATCDSEVAKVINLIAVMMDSRILFEFMREVYARKIRLGEKELIDRDLSEFFTDKAEQSETVAGWTEVATNKLKQSITRMLFEADLIENSKRPAPIRHARVDYRTEDLLKKNGLDEYLKAITGE